MSYGQDPGDGAAMEAAAVEARKAFAMLATGMTREQAEGASLVVAWLGDHFQRAGYRRLCRFLLVGGRELLAHQAGDV